jgi:hypothetical protein
MTLKVFNLFGRFAKVHFVFFLVFVNVNYKKTSDVIERYRSFECGIEYKNFAFTTRFKSQLILLNVNSFELHFWQQIQNFYSNTAIPIPMQVESLFEFFMKLIAHRIIHTDMFRIVKQKCEFFRVFFKSQT